MQLQFNPNASVSRGHISLNTGPVPTRMLSTISLFISLENQISNGTAGNVDNRDCPVATRSYFAMSTARFNQLNMFQCYSTVIHNLRTAPFLLFSVALSSPHPDPDPCIIIFHEVPRHQPNPETIQNNFHFMYMRTKKKECCSLVMPSG